LRDLFYAPKKKGSFGAPFSLVQNGLFLSFENQSGLFLSFEPKRTENEYFGISLWNFIENPVDIEV